MFKRVENNINLAKNEEKTAKFWDEINAFHKSVENRKAANRQIGRASCRERV